MPLNYTQSPLTVIQTKSDARLSSAHRLPVLRNPSHNGICIHWNTKLITRGEECAPHISSTSPLLSLYVLSVKHAEIMGRWQKDHSQGNEDGTNKVWRGLTAIPNEDGIKSSSHCVTKVPVTDDSLQETYSLNAHAQALWALMATTVQTKGRSLIKTN